MPSTRRSRQRGGGARRGLLLFLALLTSASAAALAFLVDGDTMDDSGLAVGTLAAVAGMLLVASLLPRRGPKQHFGDAEARTSKALERLDPEAWRIFDDLQFSGFDVDHVAIGPGGLLAIESRWAPTRWTLNDNAIDGAVGRPLHQAQRNATWIRKVLRNKGVQIPVVPVLVIWGPGAPELSRGSRRCGDVVVLNGAQDDEWRADLSAGRLSGQILDDASAAVEAFIADRNKQRARAAAAKA